MRRLAASVLSAFAFLIGSRGAEAKLDVIVDKSTQQMWVMIDGQARYVWRVSTGRDRHGTPNGIYRPERLERVWHSRAYYQSPMPHSIFFHNGYAIHGSYAISQLGGPASHGCVRLHPQHAEALFRLVQLEGVGNTSIVVTGNDPGRPWRVARRDLDRWGGPSVERPPEGLWAGPRPADPPMSPWRPADRGPVDLAEGRGDFGPARVPRVPPPAQMDAIDPRDNRSLVRPPQLRRGPRSPQPADPPMSPWRPPDRGPVDLAEGRGDLGPTRVPRVPSPEQMDAIDDPRENRSLARPPQLRRGPPETIERRPNPGNSKLAAPPVGAKRESSKPSSSPPRAASESAGSRPPAVAEPASSPPVRQPGEQNTANSDAEPTISAQSSYKLLPKSYWSGAAWRWRR